MDELLEPGLALEALETIERLGRLLGALKGRPLDAENHPEDRLEGLGWLAVFCSAFCFYLATAIIRWAEPYVEIDTSYFAFARFLFGFLVVWWSA